MRKILLSLPFVLLAQATSGNQNPAGLCDQAAHRAARLEGVPLDILLAIARVETGRDMGQGLSPWPWTIHTGGEGSWFDAAELALNHAEQALDGGVENIDIGCFQLNYYWHRGGFSSLEAMIEPEANAQYAASHLLSLQKSLGSWAAAVGAYHSRRTDLAEAYLGKVESLLGGGLSGQTNGVGSAQSVEAAAAPRQNSYPLLQPGSSRQSGSIVPLAGSRGALFARRG